MRQTLTRTDGYSFVLYPVSAVLEYIYFVWLVISPNFYKLQIKTYVPSARYIVKKVAILYLMLIKIIFSFQILLWSLLLYALLRLHFQMPLHSDEIKISLFVYYQK